MPVPTAVRAVEVPIPCRCFSCSRKKPQGDTDNPGETDRKKHATERDEEIHDQMIVSEHNRVGLEHSQRRRQNDGIHPAQDSDDMPKDQH